MSMMLLVISGHERDKVRVRQRHRPVCIPHSCRGLNDLMDTKLAAANNLTDESAPRNTASDAYPRPKPEEPRMIGDFDGSASKFSKFFKDEAKSHDDARIYSLKEDMESALIFVCSYSLRTCYGLFLSAHARPHRLVYFPLPSQGSYSTVNKTYRSSP